MSQDSKGKTMIGTMAPITQPHRKPVPAISATGTGTMPTPPAPPPPVSPTSVPTIMAPGTGAPPIAAPDMLVGQPLCGYFIRRKLAEGGMGEVYEGVHGTIGRIAAIKVLRQELCLSEDMLERFRQEARAVNSIRHENIVDIYDFGRDPFGRAFFVMEYLHGEPLSARIRRGPLTWAEAFPIVEQTLRALKAAHDKGFVHRDLKPDNIWLKPAEGRIQVKLLDFGIAKLVGSDGPDRLTRTGLVIGTPHYMSPEQINGSRDIDHRTDIYALGVIMYELFAGTTPFGGDTLQAIMTGHLFAEPPRLVDLAAHLGVPPPLAEVVDRMLAKQAAARYASASDVLADLYAVNANRRPAHADALRATRPLRTQPPAPDAQGAPHAQAAPRKSRAAVFAIAGVLLAGIAIAGAAIWSSRTGETQKVVVPTPEPPRPPPPGPVEVDKPLDYAAVRTAAQTLLRATLRDSAPAVRNLGSDALGTIKDVASEPALAGLTERDPDDSVRGHTAEALGALRATSQVPLLAKLEAAAAPPLKVYYTAALAWLGDARALTRLRDQAQSRDLAISYKACVVLAELSKPGDRKTIDALKALFKREQELSAIVPYAGVVILSKLAALRDPAARKVLYGSLADVNESTRLTVAEGLAKIGDDAGRKVLADIAANQASPNRLAAAVAQIALGEYGGHDVIAKALDDKDAGAREIAAQGLGAIGEPGNLKALIAATKAPEWNVRIAAAVAIMAIVGLDPMVLAQASVDWASEALTSQDWAARKAAAGVLADMPDKDAQPLFAKALVDADKRVRSQAARSAARSKSPQTAVKVAAAVVTEADPEVKEQQVKALGEIGRPEGRDALAQVAAEPGRIGILANGALIAVGDQSGVARLEAAVLDRKVEIRLAVMEAASAAKNPIVVPTLKLGVLDRVFGVQFAAAEGLAGFNAEKAAAVPVLEKALKDALTSKNFDIVGRATAALTRLGEAIKAKVHTPAEMVDSNDPRERLAAVPAVRALPVGEAVPLLRRLVADLEQDVRRAGVDAIEGVAAKDKDAAIKLYKPLLGDADPVVRAKASGQLSQLVPPPAPPPQTAAAPPTAGSPPPPPPPPIDDKLKLAAEQAAAAGGEVKTATGALEERISAASTLIAAPRGDDNDDAIKRARDLLVKIDEAAKTIEDAATKAETAATDAAGAAGAGASPAAAQLADDARKQAGMARDAATAARPRAAEAVKGLRKLIEEESPDPQVEITALIAAAQTGINQGKFDDARRKLDKAAQVLRRTGGKNARLDLTYAEYYDRMSAAAPDPATRRTLLQQAETSYRKFTATGAGPSVERARERLREIADELKAPGTP